MNDMACENCGNNCGGMLASSPTECGAWTRKPTKSEQAEMNGCEPANYIPMGEMTEHGTHLWAPSFGLTKREEFAKAAMAAWITDGLGRTLGPDKLGKQAVEYADGLLRALSHSAGGEA